MPPRSTGTRRWGLLSGCAKLAAKTAAFRSERDRGVSELPEWAWKTLTDDDFRARKLDELGDVCVAAGSPHYWNEVFYVYRDIEAYLSGLGRSPWFDADWEYWHQL